MSEIVRNSNDCESKVLLNSPLQLKGFICHADKRAPRKCSVHPRVSPGRYQQVAQGWPQGIDSQGMYMCTAILSSTLFKDEEELLL